jgi:hypothetical protein
MSDNENQFCSRPRFRRDVTTHLEIPSNVKIQVASPFDMMTMFLPEGSDTSEYDHLQKGPCFRSAARFYLPKSALKREKTFGGGIIVYDWDNSKRHFYSNFNKYFNDLQFKGSHWHIRKDTAIMRDILPRLIKGEFVEVIHWVYPYFYYRV